MAKYKSIVTTEAGLVLVEDAAYMGHAIQFTALKTGNGTYDGTEDLAAATDLKNVCQTFGVGSVSKKDSDIVVRAAINNNGVTAGYSITEIGLYATSPDTGQEILYAVVIAETGNEDYFPPYAEAPTSITLEMVIGITESEEVTFNVLPMEGAYVPVESFNEQVENIRKIVSGETPVGNAKQLGGKGASEYFTKGGGDVYNGQSAHPMAIRGSGTPAYLDYKNGQGNMLGALGFYDANRPVFVTPDYSNSFALIHENNVRNYTAGNAEYLYVQHGNEVNFKGLTGIQGVYFNYRNGDTDDMDSSPIYWYAFGDKSCSGNNMVRIDLTQGSGVRDVLHTGNKPKGSYTGNGSATNRKITVGGIGKIIMVYGTNNSVALVTATGALCADNTSVRFLDSGTVGIIDGAIISVSTADACLNASGVTYYYEQL